MFHNGWSFDENQQTVKNKLILLEFFITWFFIEERLAKEQHNTSPLMILASGSNRFEAVSRCLMSEAMGFYLNSGFIFKNNDPVKQVAKTISLNFFLFVFRLTKANQRNQDFSQKKKRDKSFQKGVVDSSKVRVQAS